MNNLASNYLPEAGYSTILFESSEFIDFQIAWDWQKEWQEKLLVEPFSEQAVWILEHMDCYTIGRGGSDGNLLFDLNHPPVDLYRIDRGGEVTYHLPGQLVIYLVINLQRYKTDLHWYLRQLENVLIDVLDQLDLHGYRVDGMTGVWCNGEKVASIGVGCRRWITQHGMSLNVNCDLSGFDQVIPCGLHEHKIGRLSTWLPNLKMEQVRYLIKKSLSKHFGLLWS